MVLSFVLRGSTLGMMLSMVYSLAVLVPSLAVSVRRLHDTGRSGWYLLLGVIPILGWLALLFFVAQEGQAGDNEYGPNPSFTPAYV